MPFTQTGVELGFSAQSTGFGASGSFGVGTTNSGAPVVDCAGNASSTRRAIDRAVEQLRLQELIRRGRNVWAA